MIGQVWRVIGTAPRDGTRVDLWCLFTSWGEELKSYAFRVIDCWFDGYWRRYDEALGGDAPVENTYPDGGAIRACLWSAVPDVPDFLVSNDDRDEGYLGSGVA